ncbi:MAG TPA: tyrosine-type recombinase/integrase [Bacillota bacterium]|nr:tyrosine-type recombinase/integrase [Bacillota bacterium]
MNLNHQILYHRFHEYLKARGFSRRTIPDYLSYTERFLTYLEDLQITDIKDVDLALMNDYQIRLLEYQHRGKPVTNTTRRRIMVAIRSFFKCLIKLDLIEHDPTAGLELPKCPKTLPRNILTKKEIAKLLEAPEMDTPFGIRDRTILEVFYSTGIRASELCNLRLNDIDLVRGELRVNQGKNSKDRVVPLGEVACDYLAVYLQIARPKLLSVDPTMLFVTNRGKQFYYTNLSALVAGYARKAGIKKRIACHSLRHTCATHLLHGKADIRYIQEILGHTSLATTQRYTKVEITDLKKVHHRCHPREQKEVNVNDGWH